MCISSKKRYIQLYSLTAEKWLHIRDIALPEPPLMAVSTTNSQHHSYKELSSPSPCHRCLSGSLDFLLQCFFVADAMMWYFLNYCSAKSLNRNSNYFVVGNMCDVLGWKDLFTTRKYFGSFGIILVDGTSLCHWFCLIVLRAQKCIYSVAIYISGFSDHILRGAGCSYWCHHHWYFIQSCTEMEPVIGLIFMMEGHIEAC